MLLTAFQFAVFEPRKVVGIATTTTPHKRFANSSLAVVRPSIKGKATTSWICEELTCVRFSGTALSIVAATILTLCLGKKVVFIALTASIDKLFARLAVSTVVIPSWHGSFTGSHDRWESTKINFNLWYKRLEFSGESGKGHFEVLFYRVASRRGTNLMKKST